MSGLIKQLAALADCGGESQHRKVGELASALTAENSALTARVQALEKALNHADSALHAYLAKRRGYGPGDPLPCELCEVLNSTPALDLSKHDETARREALEQAIERVMDCDCVGILEGSEQLTIQEAIIAGIPPSTETPTQEK